jgi:hypothetical protein
VLSDSIASLGLVIAFYYGITDLACLIYFRHELLRNLRSLLALGLVPLIGGVGLTWVFIRTAIDLSQPARHRTRHPWASVYRSRSRAVCCCLVSCCSGSPRGARRLPHWLERRRRPGRRRAQRGVRSQSSKPAVLAATRTPILSDR